MFAALAARDTRRKKSVYVHISERVYTLIAAARVVNVYNLIVFSTCLLRALERDCCETERARYTVVARLIRQFFFANINSGRREGAQGAEWALGG